MKVVELKKIATKLKIKGSNSLKKAELIKAIYETQLAAKDTPEAPQEESKAKEETQAPEATEEDKGEDNKDEDADEDDSEDSNDESEEVAPVKKPVFHRGNNRRRNSMTFR